MGVAYAEVAQTKVSEMKLIALVAGKTRHCAAGCSTLLTT